MPNQGHKKAITVLLIDKNEQDYHLLTDHLYNVRDLKFEIIWAASYEQGRAFLSDYSFDVCIFDDLAGSNTGLELLSVVKDLRLNTPIIFITEKTDAIRDALSLQLGVTDCLQKNKINASILERSIRYALEHTDALRTLRDSEEKYRGVFAGSLDIICLLDAEGRFTEINEATTRLFGFEPAIFLQKKITDLFVNESDKELFSSKISKGNNVREFEVELLTARGETCFCIVACTCLLSTLPPHNLFFQAVFHDITLRKKTEQDTIIMEKLATTGRFVRMLAHEIRNPLTNIDLSVSQLRGEGIDPDLTDYLDIIERNSRRISILLTDLLHASNPGQLKRQASFPHELLEAALELASDRISLKKIQVNRDYNTPSVLIWADPEKLSMALLNIIINAVEIVASGTGEIYLSANQEGPDWVVLRIRDNGPGIEPEFLKHIFDPYFSRKSNGLGLGLSSTLNIVQLHGGRVEVTTVRNKGTTFRVLLPVSK